MNLSSLITIGGGWLWTVGMSKLDSRHAGGVIVHDCGAAFSPPR
jgi:hypothetical protein